MLIQLNDNTRPGVFFALRTKIDVGPMPDPTTPERSSVNPPACCEIGIDALGVLADPNSSDPLRNDTSSFLFDRDLPADDWSFTLEKYSAAWLPMDSLNSSSIYCSFYDWAKYNTTKEFKGINVIWQMVLTDFGEGFYRIKAERSGLGTTVWYSEMYCLKTYTDANADGSVRFDWYLNGTQSGVNNRKIRVDYGNINWFDSIRVRGMFGFQTDELELTEVKYETGYLKNIKDQVIVKYLFKSGLLNYRTHETLRYNAFLSEKLKATDYCLLNDNPEYQNIEVKYESGYAPDFLVYNKNSRVEVGFKDRYDTTGRQIC